MQPEDRLRSASTPPNVLIVERDAAAVEALQAKLAQAGFGVTTLFDSNLTLATIERERPDLVMLDWDLPGVVAVDLVGCIRRAKFGTPPRVIILSNRNDEHQVVTGFECGADDYVIKPYSVPEAVARVRAVLRSCQHEPDQSHLLSFRELQINVRDVSLTARNHPVALRATEFRLLEFLVRNPERVFTRTQLLDRVWARESSAEERAVDVTVQRLRKSLARHHCAGYLQTVRSVGYRISATLEAGPSSPDTAATT